MTVDADTTDADISPEPGPLFHLSGIVSCDVTGPVVVTLSSETGRHQANSVCPVGGYQFDGLAPGVYEVFATLPDGSAAGFIELFLDRDYGSGTVQVTKSPIVDIEVRRADIAVALSGRRQDMSEGDAPHDIARPRATLTPGHWEMRARVPPGQYVESIDNLRSAPRRPGKAERAADWFEVFIESRGPARIRITVSDQAGQITGRVMTDSKGVPGAPVFLWAAADSARRSLGGALQTLSDTEGRFRFDSLPPGEYRMLASFDVNEIDEEVVETTRAVGVHVEASQTASVELAVWIAPLIRCGLFHVIDDQETDRPLIGRKLQSDLLLEGDKEVWPRVRGRRWIIGRTAWPSMPGRA